jgi:F-type H+-transporting ATPase subunit b
MRGFAWYRKCSAILFVILATISFAASLALGSSEGAQGGGVTVIPDWSVGIQIINFLLTIWILNLILYRPIRDILRQRKEKIERLELSIATYNEDAKEKDEAFASGIKEARARGLKEKEALLLAGAEEEKKIIEQVNAQAQTELSAMREKIARETRAVKTALQEKVDEFADDICQKILGRAIQ